MVTTLSFAAVIVWMCLGFFFGLGFHVAAWLIAHILKG